jgi:hypothetical protein
MDEFRISEKQEAAGSRKNSEIRRKRPENRREITTYNV